MHMLWNGCCMTWKNIEATQKNNSKVTVEVEKYVIIYKSYSYQN